MITPGSKPQHQSLRVRPHPILVIFVALVVSAPFVVLLIAGRKTPLNLALTFVGALLVVAALALSLRSLLKATPAGIEIRDKLRPRMLRWDEIRELVQDHDIGLKVVTTRGENIRALPYSVFRGHAEMADIARRFDDYRRAVHAPKGLDSTNER